MVHQALKSATWCAIAPAKGRGNGHAAPRMTALSDSMFPNVLVDWLGQKTQKIAWDHPAIEIRTNACPLFFYSVETAAGKAFGASLDQVVVPIVSVARLRAVGIHAALDASAGKIVAITRDGEHIIGFVEGGGFSPWHDRTEGPVSSSHEQKTSYVSLQSSGSPWAELSAEGRTPLALTMPRTLFFRHGVASPFVVACAEPVDHDQIGDSPRKTWAEVRRDLLDKGRQLHPYDGESIMIIRRGDKAGHNGTPMPVAKIVAPR